MKNKKLIATVASLCLIVVAVVAAVVGVLAAVQQNVTNKVKVSYVANNVNADVAIAGRLERANAFTNTATGEGVETSHHFAPQQGTTTATLTSSDLELVWSENTLDRYAVYQFKFDNLSSTRYLEVKMTYSQPSTLDNVTLAWFSSTSDSFTPTIAYTAAGALNGTITGDENSSALNVVAGTPLAVWTGATCLNTASSENTQDTGYIYLVVATTDLNSDSHFGLGGETGNYANTLAFELNSKTARSA